MKEQLEQIRASAMAALEQAREAADLDALRVKVLGKKGELTAVLKTMGKPGLNRPRKPSLMPVPSILTPHWQTFTTR